MAAYYNEIDSYCAQWLRNLIAAGHIAPRDVDERDIRDVRADDLRGYGQCHFFAGIGGWSYALRLANWPDDRPVWTGSCPCQPFSAAGSQRGSEDERHLWPAFFRLIGECHPATVFGEQVAGAAGLAWLDHVHADLEGAGYAVAAADLPACGVGAPHRRQRLWWVAHAEQWPTERRGHDMAGTARGAEEEAWERQRVRSDIGPGGINVGMANADSRERRAAQGHADAGADRRNDFRRRGEDGGAGSERMGDADGFGLQIHGDRGNLRCESPPRARGEIDPWCDLEWLPCSDGKARPTQPGLFPLAHGVPGRVGRLRAYGNAIIPQIAAEFIKAYLDEENSK